MKINWLTFLFRKNIQKKQNSANKTFLKVKRSFTLFLLTEVIFTFSLLRNTGRENVFLTFHINGILESRNKYPYHPRPISLLETESMLYM